MSTEPTHPDIDPDEVKAFLKQPEAEPDISDDDPLDALNLSSHEKTIEVPLSEEDLADLGKAGEEKEEVKEFSKPQGAFHAWSGIEQDSKDPYSRVLPGIGKVTVTR